MQVVSREMCSFIKERVLLRVCVWFREDAAEEKGPFVQYRHRGLGFRVQGEGKRERLY